MGLLEDLTKSTGGVTEFLGRNPQLVAAACSMLSSREGTIGPADGLGGLTKAFASKGLGDVVSSWISTGPNREVSGAQVASALGDDTLAQFSRQAGIPHGQASGVLASLLPVLIDRLTPHGSAPEASGLEDQLGGLLQGFRPSH